MNYQIESLQPEDWPKVRSIFAESIKTGISTFDTKLPDWEDWDSSRLSTCRFVAREGKTVFGWASLSPSSSTWGYVGVAEVSVHVGKAVQKQGIGTALLKALFAASENEKYWDINCRNNFRKQGEL